MNFFNCNSVWAQKARMRTLADGVKSVTIHTIVSTQYQHCTDTQTTMSYQYRGVSILLCDETDKYKTWLIPDTTRINGCPENYTKNGHSNHH